MLDIVKHNLTKLKEEFGQHMAANIHYDPVEDVFEVQIVEKKDKEQRHVKSFAVKSEEEVYARMASLYDIKKETQR